MVVRKAGSGAVLLLAGVLLAQAAITQPIPNASTPEASHYGNPQTPSWAIQKDTSTMYYNQNGQYIGKSRTSGRNTNLYDNQGRWQGYLHQEIK